MILPENTFLSAASCSENICHMIAFALREVDYLRNDPEKNSSVLSVVIYTAGELFRREPMRIGTSFGRRLDSILSLLELRRRDMQVERQEGNTRPSYPGCTVGTWSLRKHAFVGSCITDTPHFADEGCVELKREGIIEREYYVY